MSYQVSESQVRQLFSNMGYDIEGIDKEKLQRKVCQLQQYVKDGDTLTETDDLNLRDELLERLGKGESIELHPDTACAVVAEQQTTVAVLEMPSGAAAPEVANGESSATTPKPATQPTKRGRKPKQQPTKETHKTPRQGVRSGTGGFRSTQPLIYGQSAISVARWLGYAGFKPSQAKSVLSHFGAEFKDETLRTYITDGKRADEKYGKRAVLTAEQETELQALKPAVEEKKEEVVVAEA